MKKTLLIAVIISVAGSLAGRAQSTRPVTYSLDIKLLEQNRSRIKANDPLLMPAYKLLIKDADKALKSVPVSVMEKKNIPPSGSKHDYMSLAPYHWPDPSKPDGLPYIRKDGQTNPEVKEYKDKEYMPKLCADVNTLALASFFSGEPMYAEHAATLLRVWFLDTATRMNPNLNFAQAIKGENTGRGAGIIDSRHFIKLVDAIGLMQGSKSWSAKDQSGMVQWFREYLEWMQSSPIGRQEMKTVNNHGVWYDAQALSLALFTGQDEVAKKIIYSAYNRLDMQMNEAGLFPKELERTTSLHYSVFVMEAFFQVAHMAEKTGLDFWKYSSPSGKSNQKGFDALYPYLSKEKTWEGQQIKEFDFEEGYDLMIDAATHYKCKKCKETIRELAGDKYERLRIHLLN